MHHREIAAGVLAIFAGVLLLFRFGLVAVDVPLVLAGDVISYTRPDGGVSVIRPAPRCLQELQRMIGTPQAAGECPPLGLTAAQAVVWIRDKDVSADATNVSIHDDSLLPSRAKRDAWRKVDGAVVIDATVAVEQPEALRKSLGSIFAGTAAQKRARWVDVLEKYPAAAALLTLLRGTITPDAKATIAELSTRICQKVGGGASEILTATEYDAYKTLADGKGLGALVPARPCP